MKSSVSKLKTGAEPSSQHDNASDLDFREKLIQPCVIGNLGGQEISNFKSSNTLRNTVLAHPFPRAKRFKVRKPYYNDTLILETQKWLNHSIIEKKVISLLSV